MHCDPSPGVPEPNPVQAHYARPALARTILEAAVPPVGSATGVDVGALAPVDEFHVRGREATLELAQAVALTPSNRVLDVGCGLGGASRYLASAFGCQVVGIDLTPDYVETARLLAARFGLDHRVRYECADALALPFREAEFDVVWTQHAAMNIADKAGLYAEMFRVLKPGGCLALYDILAGEGGEVHFPSPWARKASISFLIKPDVLNRLLTAVGFRDDYLKVVRRNRDGISSWEKILWQTLITIIAAGYPGVRTSAVGLSPPHGGRLPRHGLEFAPKPGRESNRPN